MKTLKILLSLLVLISISYMLACDVNKYSLSDNPVSNKGNTNLSVNDAPNAIPDKCPFPSPCTGVHFCLYLKYGDTGEWFPMSNIKSVNVTHTGKDCNNYNFNCFYNRTAKSPTPPMNETDLGCVLPWYNNNCVYTRTVCLITWDNQTYTGSLTFGYAGYSGCIVDVYPSNFQCPFDE